MLRYHVAYLAQAHCEAARRIAQLGKSGRCGNNRLALAHPVSIDFHEIRITNSIQLMARPATLFTGQWADLTLDTVAQKAKSFGYDGLELACWGDHFDVTNAQDKQYCDDRPALLAKHPRQTSAGAHHRA